jgi:hypothetical protein
VILDPKNLIFRVLSVDHGNRDLSLTAEILLSDSDICTPNV